MHWVLQSLPHHAPTLSPSFFTFLLFLETSNLLMKIKKYKKWARSPCHGNHFSSIYNWASEESPTLGCSIEISRDILFMSVCMSVVVQKA